MTPDSDDLEKALQQNLKIRRELGTEIGKADGIRPAIQDQGLVYRLGWVLYWIALTLALASGIYVLVSMADAGVLSLIAALILAVAFYGIGRAFRYVLSGK